MNISTDHVLFESIETLFHKGNFMAALDLLKKIEEQGKLDNKILLKKHHKLMFQILTCHKEMQELEKQNQENYELGFLYLNFEKFNQAHAIFSKLYLTNPNDINALLGLIKTSLKMEIDIPEEQIYFLEHQVHTNNLANWQYYGVSNEILGDYYVTENKEKALYFFEQALKSNPQDPELNFKYAHMHLHIHRDILSIEQYITSSLNQTASLDLEKALAINYAILLAFEKRELKKAREFLKILRSSFSAHYSLLREFRKEFKEETQFLHGNIDKVIKTLKHKTSIKPENHECHDNLIMLSHYSNSISAAETLSFAQTYYKNCVIPFKKNINLNFNFSHLLDNFQRDPTQNIKLGLVSGDFKNHPGFIGIKNLLQYLHQNTNYRFDVHCYANNDPNECSEYIKAIGHKIEYIQHLSDAELSKKIYNDKIHILLDLSGHTAGNRLLTFALKPAPLQITWLGQSGPMGLPEIDYMLADQLHIENDEEIFYTEKIHYLSHMVSYPAKEHDDIEINRSLAKDDNSIVFGSFNHSMKINPIVLNTWAQILRLVPHSTLLMSNHQLSVLGYQRKIIEFFSNAGIDKNRIKFDFVSDKLAYFQRFKKIDIALDPFPFTGSTTTYETLLMSIPLICMQGKRLSHRYSSSILRTIGLEELIAQSKDEYIDKIVNLANSPEKILYYKNSIRERYLKSPLTDTEAFAKNFFEALKYLWDEKLSSFQYPPNT